MFMQGYMQQKLWKYMCQSTGYEVGAWKTYFSLEAEKRECISITYLQTTKPTKSICFFLSPYPAVLNNFSNKILLSPKADHLTLIISHSCCAIPSKVKKWGLPWWSSGYDSELPLQRAQVQSWVGQLRLLRLHSAAKKKKNFFFKKSYPSEKIKLHQRANWSRKLCESVCLCKNKKYILCVYYAKSMTSSLRPYHPCSGLYLYSLYFSTLPHH